MDHLARQLVDATGDARVPPEDLGLYLLDVVLEAAHDGPVVVHDPVHDGVQDGLRPTPQELGVGFEALAHHAHVRRLAVADGDNEVRTEEDVDLAELDPLHLVEVAGGLVHDKQRPAVALQFGPLVGVQRASAAKG